MDVDYYKQSRPLITANKINFQEIKRTMIAENPIETLTNSLPQMALVARLHKLNICDFHQALETFNLLIKSIQEN